MKIKLAVLYLQYDQDKYPNSFAKLKEYLSKLSFCDQKIYIIDNADENKPITKLNENTWKMSGDNSNWEFSGWQKAINHLNNNDIDYNMVLLVNDAFLTYGCTFGENDLNQSILTECLKENYFYGQICSAPSLKPLVINKYDVTKWVRTHFCFITKEILKNIKELTSINNKNINSYIENEPTNNYFKLNAPINQGFREHNTNWLTKMWHSKFVLEENWALYRNKTKAIMNEKILTARVREKGYKIIGYVMPDKFIQRKLYNLTSFFNKPETIKRVMRFIEKYRSKKIAFYGAGVFAKTFIQMYHYLFLGLDIVCFIDADPSKHGGFIEGYPIYSPEHLSNLDIEVVALTVEKTDAILPKVQQLKKNNSSSYEIIDDFYRKTIS